MNLLSKSTASPVSLIRLCLACQFKNVDDRQLLLIVATGHRPFSTVNGPLCINSSLKNRSFSKLRLKRDPVSSMDTNHVEPFRMKKALILTKFSRLEFEQRRHPEWTAEQLRRNLQRRGSDYDNLVQHHAVHSRSRDQVIRSLENCGVETKMVNRFEYTADDIDWADVIFTTGGDGTFLMAASKVTTRDKPVIGINTDPASSVGHLCLPTVYSSDFTKAIDKLHAGQFKWMYRQRLRITLEGENALEEPIELHDQQLLHPEYRYLDLEPQHQPPRTEATVVGRRALPVRALNEVFVGESLSSRVSYYEIGIDGQPSEKLKSSGLTICTGTGSTSWTFNINKVTPQCVRSLCSIIQDEAGVALPLDENAVERITSRFNKSLIFSPSEQKMAYTIRDPVVFGTNFNSSPRGFANQVDVRSRMFDACLVIDGALSYKFNDGAKARFELYPEDALKTIYIE